MEYDLILHAHNYALDVHDGQRYGDKPYIFHLDGVARLADERNKFPQLRSTVIACCYLHDTIEDTDVTHEDLVKVFGVCIADVVRYVTKVEGESYEAYMMKVLSSVLAIEVKKCDTMFNLHNSFKEGNKARVLKYLKQLEILEKREGLYHEV